MVTMSQKSSVPQAAKSVSQALTSDTINNLALVYQAQGKYSEAEGLIKRALVIREKAVGEDQSMSSERATPPLPAPSKT